MATNSPKKIIVQFLAAIGCMYNSISKPIRKAKHKISCFFKAIFTERRQRDILAGLTGVLVMLVVARTMEAERSVDIQIPTENEQVTQLSAQVYSNDIPTVNTDAVELARVLYGVRDYNLSDNAKTAIIEVVLNRVKCTYGEFGDTIQEVCSKPEQWQGYVTDGEYLKTDYDLACSILNDTSGARVTPGQCLFLVCDYGSVTVRPEWSGGNEWTVK